jgi:hypothetical protein
MVIIVFSLIPASEQLGSEGAFSFHFRCAGDRGVVA